MFVRVWTSCRWDEHEEVGFCSERVEILFSAIYDTSKELAAKATAVQNRSVINHVAELVSLSSRPPTYISSHSSSDDASSAPRYIHIYVRMHCSGRIW